MSTSSRARRVESRLPWRAYQTIVEALKGIRRGEDDAYVAEALRHDLPRLSFIEVVQWTRLLGLRRQEIEDKQPHVPRTLVEIEDLSERDDERSLREFLEALPEETALRLQTLYYAGRDQDREVAELHEYLSDKTDEGAAESLNGKVPLDECLGAGLKILRDLGVDPNGPWHLKTPPDRSAPSNGASRWRVATSTSVEKPTRSR